jgi:hypothetical protein
MNICTIANEFSGKLDSTHGRDAAGHAKNNDFPF